MADILLPVLFVVVTGVLVVGVLLLLWPRRIFRSRADDASGPVDPTGERLGAP